MKLALSKKLFLVFFFALAVKASAQQDWELSKDKNDIKVYTRKTDSSDFKSVKVEAVFTGSCEKLAGVLMGVDKNIRWVYNTKSLHLIQRFSANELIYYAETSLPWPMRNRDQAIRINLFPDSINHALKITTVGEPKAIPVTKGIVRVPYFLGVWQVKEIAGKKISIEYYLNVDPGGSIPAWISNMFVAKGPYETFVNLSKLLKQ
ncbi:MAG TPA: START domain-containing protein [Ginsengibacter sp.]|nr:START domain-containing protein [Ginsengibacter sp.]